MTEHIVARIDRIFQDAGYRGYRQYLDWTGYDPFMGAAYLERDLERERQSLIALGYEPETRWAANFWLPIWLDHDPADFLDRAVRDVYPMLGFGQDQIAAARRMALSRIPACRVIMEYYGTLQ
jgi:hypothetical protein